jgi:hypothetical protein
MIFRYDQLRSFFDQINRKGQSRRFRDWQRDAVFLIRHDIDFDLQLAHKVAKIEFEKGIVATFFVLTSCQSYNPLCKASRLLLKEIVAMGHEIGLHFDPTLYTTNLSSHVAREAEILSDACGDSVRSVSLHNPSVHGQFPIFDGFINAYDPTLFSDDNYISDSCFNFRGKNPYEFLDRIENGMVQILLHPMHYSEHGWGYERILPSTFLQYISDVHVNFLINQTYCDQVGQDIITHLRAMLK